MLPARMWRRCRCGPFFRSVAALGGDRRAAMAPKAQPAAVPHGYRFITQKGGKWMVQTRSGGAKYHGGFHDAPREAAHASDK